MQQSRTFPFVLLVEDHGDSRLILKLLLETLEYHVLAAANGKQALEIARNEKISLIITDFDLPDMTGAALLRLLNKYDGVIQPPSIVLTAHDEKEYRRMSDEAGCKAYLLKPVNFDLLVETIERLLCETTAPDDSEENAINEIPCTAKQT